NGCFVVAMSPRFEDQHCDALLSEPRFYARKKAMLVPLNIDLQQINTVLSNQIEESIAGNNGYADCIARIARRCDHRLTQIVSYDGELGLAVDIRNRILVYTEPSIDTGQRS